MQGRFTLVKLIKQEIDISPIGEQVVRKNITEVYGLITSVTSEEWFNAHRNDINARYSVRVHAFEYKGQELAEIDGIKYRIYRTYESGVDYIELKLEQKVGTV